MKRKDYSRRDLFSRIYLDWGAYLRDGVKVTCEIGQQTKDECPDPSNQNPQNMRVRSDKPDSAGADDLEARYYLAADSIGGIAACVRDRKGCVFGVRGTNAGWQNMTNPQPPAPGSAEWGHALYAFGFHMHDGQKCIIAKSSWCGVQSGHHEHHIKQNYFNAGAVFNAWVLVPKDNNMIELIESRGTIYLTANGKPIYGYANMDLVQPLLDAGVPLRKLDLANAVEVFTFSPGLIAHRK